LTAQNFDEVDPYHGSSIWTWSKVQEF
jgi:hypothetical protein